MQSIKDAITECYKAAKRFKRRIIGELIWYHLIPA
jgi:hypothetical protein